MEKVHHDKSLIEKYKLACKGLNAQKSTIKPTDSKRIPKSMEMSIRSFKINQNNSIIGKTRLTQRRSKDKSIENAKHQGSVESRKNKSKTNYKPQTAQINLYATQAIPSKIKENKVSAVINNPADNLKVSIKKKDKFLLSSK